MARGFLSSLRTVRDPAGKAVVLFGAGGAARAIAVEAARAGAASITVVNRNPSRGAELVELINERTQATARLEPWERTYAVPADTDIVVNATSIGLFPHTDGRPNIDLDSFCLAWSWRTSSPIPQRLPYSRAPANGAAPPSMDWACLSSRA